MINAEDYQALLNTSTVPDNFESLEAMVVARIGAAVSRNLPRASYTEFITTYQDAKIYTKEFPIIDTTFDNLGITQYYIVGKAPLNFESVTYTAGYSNYGTSGDQYACPINLALAVAYGIKTLSESSSNGTAQTDNTTAVSVGGDYSVTFNPNMRIGADGVELPLSMISLYDLGGRCAQLALKFKRPPLC